MSQLKCKLDNIRLKRNKDFELEIDELTLPLNSNFIEGANKIPILGISGAGKSTLLNLLAGIEWPDRGTISWSFPNHKEDCHWSNEGPTPSHYLRLRRHYFGFAFQDNTLTPYLRIRDNLCYPLRLKGYCSDQAMRAVRELMKKVLLKEEMREIDSFLMGFPSKLSGGQLQRVSLAQAIIHDPYVIFADEPTGSLDSATRKQVMNVLYEWANEPKKQGERLLIWVTHHDEDPQSAGTEQYLNVILENQKSKTIIINVELNSSRTQT